MCSCEYVFQESHRVPYNCDETLFILKFLSFCEDFLMFRDFLLIEKCHWITQFSFYRHFFWVQNQQVVSEVNRFYVSTFTSILFFIKEDRPWLKINI